MSRDKFETWLKYCPHKLSTEMSKAYPAHYKYIETQIAWDAWRAALESHHVSMAIRNIAGELYQCAGAYNMPSNVMDILSSLQRGEFPEEINLLPCSSPKQPEVPDFIDSEDAPQPYFDDIDFAEAYADGWNDCRRRMLEQMEDDE